MKTLFLIAVICMVLSQVEGFNSRRYKNAELETEDKLEKLLNALRELRGTSSEEAGKGSDENDGSDQTENLDEGDDSKDSNESGNSDERRVLKKGSGESDEEPDICDKLEEEDFDGFVPSDPCVKMLLVAAKGACENDGEEFDACENVAADFENEGSFEEEADFCDLSGEEQINAILCVFDDDDLSDLQGYIIGLVEQAFGVFNEEKHAKAVRAVANIFKKSFGKRLLV